MLDLSARNLKKKFGSVCFHILKDMSLLIFLKNSSSRTGF